MELLLAATPCFRKGAPYDTPSATHDRRHAGAESRTEHADVVRATGLSVCTPFQQVTGGARTRGDPRLSGVCTLPTKRSWLPVPF